MNVLAGLSAAGYLALALAGDLRARIGLVLAVQAALFAVYLAAALLALRARDGAPRLGAIAGAALLFRLALLPAPPTLSDDVYRYVWEGRLQLRGINPYLHAPSDPDLASYRDRVYEGINNKELPAIYPPLMQWAFALGALAGGSVTAMKALMVAADMGVVALLARLLRARGLDPRRVVLYAWNPLAVVEVAGSGHNDPLAVCLLLAATLGIIGNRRVLSMTALAGAALGKVFPLALLPLFAGRVRWKHLLVPPALAALCYLPYLPAGANLWHSGRAYAERWRFNDSVFGGAVLLAEGSGLPGPLKRAFDAREWPSLYTQPDMLARGATALALVVVLAVLALRARRRPDGLERAIFLFTGWCLILAPTLHPWYLLWILPWMAVYPSPAWIALSATAALAYVPGGPPRLLEYAPFYLLLAVGPALRRAAREGVIEWAAVEKETR